MDMKVIEGCCRSTITLWTADDKDENIEIKVAKGRTNEIFTAIRNAWQNDISQKGFSQDGMAGNLT
jgi:hypothetical protein